jgi:hypothetical protein
MPAHGKLVVIDPAIGRQEGLGVLLLAPIRARYLLVVRSLPGGTRQANGGGS